MQPGITIQPCGLGNENLPQTAALSRIAESLQLVGKYYLGGLVFLFGSLILKETGIQTPGGNDNE